MKKLIVFTLMALLLFFTLNGCSTKENTTPSEPTDMAPTETPTEALTKAPSDAPEDEFAGYPIETDKELSFWLIGPYPHAEYTDASESPWHQWITENTGVQIDWKYPAAGADIQQAYNLMLVSGDLPDMIYNSGLPEQCESLLVDKYIISLDDYMVSCAPNLNSYLQEHPEFNKAIKSDSGHYYNFPFIREDVAWMGTYLGPTIRSDSLEELSLEIPVTISEWDNMLRGFDTVCDIPLCVYNGSYLLRLFGNAYDFYHTYYVDDQEAKVWYNADGYLNFLTQMSQWYEDGILDPDFVTMDMTGFVSKMSTQKIGATIMGTNTPTRFKTAMEDNGIPYTYIGGSYPIADEGGTYSHVFGEAIWNTLGAMVTTACEDVELACRFLDYGYSEEGIVAFNFGKEGVSFEYVNGKPVFLSDVRESPEGMTVALSRYTPMTGSWVSMMLVSFGEQKNLPEANEYISKWTDNTDPSVLHRMPPMCATLEESTELSNLESALSTYAEEMYYKFIIGAEDLANYEDYLENLKELHIDRILEIKTTQLTRYNAR